MINIDNKFDIGQLVYIKTDTEQLPRMVTNLEISKDSLIYVVYAGTVCSKHYDFELSENQVYNPALK